jgi:hypothetical protein
MKNYNHDTFDKQCILYAKQCFNCKEMTEKMVIFYIIMKASLKPFIQRQAYADRVHYYWLLLKKMYT